MQKDLRKQLEEDFYESFDELSGCIYNDCDYIREDIRQWLLNILEKDKKIYLDKIIQYITKI